MMVLKHKTNVIIHIHGLKQEKSCVFSIFKLTWINYDSIDYLINNVSFQNLFCSFLNNVKHLVKLQPKNYVDKC